MDWKQIWQNITRLNHNRKIKQFQWKCVHNIIFTERKLQRIGRSNGKCKICNSNEEDQKHLFIGCRYTIRIWEEIMNDINENLIKMNKQGRNITEEDMTEENIIWNHKRR